MSSSIDEIIFPCGVNIEVKENTLSTGYPSSASSSLLMDGSSFPFRSMFSLYKSSLVTRAFEILSSSSKNPRL